MELEDKITKNILRTLQKENKPLTPSDIAKKLSTSRLLIYFGLGYLLGTEKIRMDKVGNRWVVQLK